MCHVVMVCVEPPSATYLSTIIGMRQFAEGLLDPQEALAGQGSSQGSDNVRIVY